jgi:hypothetical protein
VKLRNSEIKKQLLTLANLETMVADAELRIEELQQAAVDAGMDIGSTQVCARCTIHCICCCAKWVGFARFCETRHAPGCGVRAWKCPRAAMLDTGPEQMQRNAMWSRAYWRW